MKKYIWMLSLFFALCLCILAYQNNIRSDLAWWFHLFSLHKLALNQNFMAFLANPIFIFFIIAYKLL